jgi:urease subunit gamma/beta
MRLTPWEEERLLIFTAAELARRHRTAGLALNAPEAIALICDAMLEAARAGADYEAVESAGRTAVGPGEVIAGVRELVDEVRLEVLMGDGARLVVLVDPLRTGLPELVGAADGPGAIRMNRQPTDPTAVSYTI